jgi:hypothetical protein
MTRLALEPTNHESSLTRDIGPIAAETTPLTPPDVLVAMDVRPSWQDRHMETERMTSRAFTLDDVHALVELDSEPEVRR